MNSLRRPDLPRDEELCLLSNRSRRAVLSELRDRPSEQVPIRALADVLAEETGEDRSSLEIELRHVHLPRLDDHGIVSFNPGEKTVAYLGDDDIETLLDELSH